jgi:gamma-glutamyltranspeptidase
VVEPQSSGIGGGGFLIHHDGRSRALTSYDGREEAPSAAGPAWFLDASGKPWPTPRSEAGRPECPAISACLHWPMANMASCPGPSCSSLRSGSRGTGTG